MTAALKLIRNIKQIQIHFQETFIFYIILSSNLINNRINKNYIITSSFLQIFWIIGVLKEFAKFAIKRLCSCLVFYIVASWNYKLNIKSLMYLLLITKSKRPEPFTECALTHN